jgi:hypothetical protein
MASLIGRLRRRDDDPEPTPDDATTGHRDVDDSSAASTHGPPAEPSQEARTPLGSDGVPYRPGDPRFPDTWGRHPRSPYARSIG